MAKFALINTLNGHHYDDGQILGSVISRHRTPEAAVKANDKFQRAVKRANGSSSYIPTEIIEISHDCGEGWVRGRRANVDTCPYTD